MKKLVREKIINEQWTSSVSRDIPLRYDSAEDVLSNPDDQEVTPAELMPPANIKLTPNQFNSYIDNLINLILPNSPALAINTFSMVLKMHPYLTKRTIGFKGINPYKDSINKFLFLYRKMTDEMNKGEK